ncbi:MAG: hypothetical protein Ct9H300mP10_09360 [Methanobacteriota archaeon]|nr:MAG: hypothetical protein Ct9H300mP10_09360 [Euryarchaeota archaeon]
MSLALAFRDSPLPPIWPTLAARFTSMKFAVTVGPVSMAFFQGIENWTSGSDFFNEIQEWGFDPDEFKSDAFDVIDLVHPDDEITQPRTSGVAFRIVERGTAEHCIDQGFKRMAWTLERRFTTIHAGVRRTVT